MSVFLGVGGSIAPVGVSSPFWSTLTLSPLTSTNAGPTSGGAGAGVGADTHLRSAGMRRSVDGAGSRRRVGFGLRLFDDDGEDHGADGDHDHSQRIQSTHDENNGNTQTTQQDHTRCKDEHVDLHLPSESPVRPALVPFSRASSRIRLKHQATVDSMTRINMKEEDAHDEHTIMQLSTPTRSPHSRRSASSSLCSPAPVTAADRLPPHSHHLLDTPNMQIIIASPPTRGSRRSFTDSSPSDSASHLDRSAVSSIDSPSFHSPDRRSIPEFHSPAFSPTISTPVAPSSSLGGHRRFSTRDTPHKLTFGVSSPSMFSPAPSGSFHHHATLRGMSEDSPHTAEYARTKLRATLTPDGTPGPTPRSSSLYASSSGTRKLFDTHSAPNSPAPMPSGITDSPSAAETNAMPIGAISISVSGGEAMQADAPAATDSSSTSAAAASSATDSSISMTDPASSPVTLDPAPNSSPFLGSLPAADSASSSTLVSATTAALTSLIGSMPMQQQQPQQANPPPFNNTPNANTASSQQHKPCNCKKSKCLKLYCECFARQDFCRGCNCVGCFNTPEAENKPTRDKAVLATMERDPQAFFRAQLQQGVQVDAAKERITSKPQSTQMQTMQQPAMVNMQNIPTLSSMPIVSTHPSSGRSVLPSLVSGGGGGVKLYRKGCHCKKSECLKKYCECYQAGVPCDSSCKCSDCKNGHHDGVHDERAKQMKRSKSVSSKPKSMYNMPGMPIGVNTGGSLIPPNLTSVPHGFHPDLFAAQSYMMNAFLTPELMASFFHQSNQQAMAAAMQSAAAAAAAAATTNTNATTATTTTAGTSDTTSAAAPDSAAPVTDSSVAVSGSPVKSSDPIPPYPVSSPSIVSPSLKAASTPIPPPNHTPSAPVVTDSTDSTSQTRSTTDLLAPDVDMDDSSSGSAKNAAGVTAVDTPTMASKRSSRTITSTSRAAEWKAASATAGAGRAKATKTRLSSTLDALPAGRGAGKPAVGAAELNSTLLQNDASDPAVSATDDDAQPDTPTHATHAHRQKRQRHTPTHLMT